MHGIMGGSWLATSLPAPRSPHAGDAWAEGGPEGGTWAAWLVNNPSGGPLRGPVGRVREELRMELRAAVRHAYLGPEVQARVHMAGEPQTVKSCPRDGYSGQWMRLFNSACLRLYGRRTVGTITRE